MLKRPLDARFSAEILSGRKVTTIREKAWPVGREIMLYNWTAAPYRSRQRDVAVVMVEWTCEIAITRAVDDRVRFHVPQPVKVMRELGRCLWETEGFQSREELEAWFRVYLRPRETMVKHLMRPAEVVAVVNVGEGN